MGGEGPRPAATGDPPAQRGCPGPAATSLTRTAHGQLGVSRLRHRPAPTPEGLPVHGHSHPSTPPRQDPAPPPTPVSPLAHEHQARTQGLRCSCCLATRPNSPQLRAPGSEASAQMPRPQEAPPRSFHTQQPLPASRPPSPLSSAFSLLRDLSPSDSLAGCPFHQHASSTRAGVAPVTSPDGPQHLAGRACAGRVPSGHRKTPPRALGRAHLLGAPDPSRSLRRCVHTHTAPAA